MRANAEIVKLLKTPVVRDRFVGAGLEPRSSTPEEFRDIIRREIPLWHKVAKQANIKVE